MTDAQKAVLKAEIQKSYYQGKTFREIARMLNAWPMVDNLEPTPNIPKPITGEAVQTLVSKVSVSQEAVAELVGLVIDGNRQGVREWAGLYLNDVGQTIIANYLDDVVPDPDWPVKVRGDSKTVELGLTPLEWGGMTFTNSIPRGAVEEVL